MSSQLTPSITGAAGSPTVNPSISNPASENDDDVSSPSDFVVSRLRARNEISRGFFPRQCDLLAAACCEMARRFRAGGRLFAFGRDHHATDAQQVAVQYVQPPAGGRSPLPAFDLSLGFVQRVSAVLRPDDMLIGFAPPAGDQLVAAVLGRAGLMGAQTFALCGSHGSYAVAAPSADPYVHQEILEVLHHTLCETVHLALGGRLRSVDGDGDDGEHGRSESTVDDDDGSALLDRVSASILARSRQADRLRDQVAGESAQAIATVAEAIRQRVSGGGRVLLFGNGGSATDANDWALDCSLPLKEFPPLPALSLAFEPANVPTPTSAVPLAATGNPGFGHHLALFGRPEDVAVAICTSRRAREMVRPLERSRQMGMLNVALLGHDGGDVVRQGLADHTLVVRSEEVPRIQEVHASIYHTILEVIAEG